MKKWLVTGGAGFIGCNFIELILTEHDDVGVVCADKLTYAGNYDNLIPFQGHPRFAFHKIDICDREAVFELFASERFDCVINFAAESHVDRSIADPGIFIQTNVMGTLVLLDAVNAYRVPRFHQVSTDEVYGDLPIDRLDLQFIETWGLKASSPYSASKASADLLILAYFRTFRTPVSISRCSNNYGPYQFPEKLIPLMLYNAAHDIPLPIYGDGLNIRDWLFVKDHCKAIDMLVTADAVGEIYNIGGHNERSNTAVVHEILAHTGKPDSLITHVKDRRGHDRRYAVNTEKIRRDIGWAPEVDFDKGIQKTFEWYRTNTEWMDRVKSGAYIHAYEKAGNR